MGVLLGPGQETVERKAVAGGRWQVAAGSDGESSRALLWG